MNKAVYFICADDEFIADNRAKELFAELSQEVSDDMSKEIIQGTANNASEAERICQNATESARTFSLFGGKKLVWLRALNFLNDSAVRSKSAQETLEKFAEFASKLNPDEVSLVISAYNADKRKKAFKILKDASNFEMFEAANASDACAQLLRQESQKLGVNFEGGAMDILISTVAANPRMALSELRKLAAYLNFQGTITKKDVVEMVPIFGEGDFFELTNLFYEGNLEASLKALRRYFFTNKNASARPIISVLQKQNSLLLQIRALMDEGSLSRYASLPKGNFENAANRYADRYKCSTKSSYNLFSQNPWYVSNRLAPTAAKVSLKKLMDVQMNLVQAFEDLINRPHSDEAIMRELFSKI